MSEKNLIKKIQVAATNLGARLFRNNTGRGWVGKLDTSGMPARLLIHDPRPLDAGLYKGSSDVIGWTKVKVTPEMVGTEVAIFTSIEVKWNKTRTSGPQKTWILNVQRSGGIAGVARTVDEAMKMIEQYEPEEHS